MALLLVATWFKVWNIFIIPLVTVKLFCRTGEIRLFLAYRKTDFVQLAYNYLLISLLVISLRHENVLVF